MIKPDSWIRTMCGKIPPMIEPFFERIAGDGIISWGLQPHGYDARLDPKIRVLSDAQVAGQDLDPLDPDREKKFYFDVNIDDRPGKYYSIPPHGVVLVQTIEYFRIPRNISVRGLPKNIYSSVGIDPHIASISAGWEGHLRISISNTTQVPIRLYANMGIVFFEFNAIEGEVERDYSQLEGTRFQGTGPVRSTA